RSLRCSAAPCPRMNTLFLFTAPPPPAVSPLSLHDALPICREPRQPARRDDGARPHRAARHALARVVGRLLAPRGRQRAHAAHDRSEEHTSELQSRSDLVCRLLLEKKKSSSTTPITACEPQS